MSAENAEAKTGQGWKHLYSHVLGLNLGLVRRGFSNLYAHSCNLGVLVSPLVTALLFKMEEANLASRAKAQELIQATNQV